MSQQEKAENQLARLTATFRQLGVDDPEGYATSQLSEGIPHLAYLVFLKQAWSEIVDETATGWIDQYIEWGRRDGASKTFWGGLGRALELMKGKGISDADIATVVQVMQYLLLASICGQLDDCDTSPINVQGDWPAVRWTLFEVDAEGNPIRPMKGLTDYADSQDPTGRRDGFRSK